jgi:hypothetical protein
MYLCHMKNLIVAILLTLSATLTSFAPGKDEINYIEIGGNQVATYTKKFCFIGLCNEFEIKSMDGNLLASIVRQEVKNHTAISAGNPDGKIPYYEWTFYETSTKVECTEMFAAKKLSKFCEDQGLFNKDGINEKGIKNFAMKYGRKFTDEKNRTQIIEHR